MSFCAACGTESVGNESFCRQCGAALGANAPAAPVANQGLPPLPPTGYVASAAPPPPPPPPPSGYPSAPQQAYYAQPTAPVGSLALWGPRALAYLIDYAWLIPVYIIFAVISSDLVFLPSLLAIGASLFWSFQLGETGQTPGMRVIGLKCVGQATGQPIGFGLAVVRWLAHIVDGIICEIGWLFPLWDQNRQTLADKIMSTVVVTVPKQAFSISPTPT
jgi:uncharacterized RDD family membrane protein YckC